MTWKMLILTEGSNQIGLGHVYRCSAILEEASSRNIHVKMIISDTKDLPIFKDNTQINYQDWKNLESLDNILQKEKPDLIVVDSYLADYAIYKRLSKESSKLLIIDDNNYFRYHSGTIINPAFNAKNMDYPYTNKNFEFWLGSDYTILRKSFRSTQSKNVTDKVKNIFVMIGGSDVLKIAPAIVLEVLTYFKDAEITLVNSEFDHEKVISVFNLGEQEIHKKISESDIAIVGAGQTIFEMIATKTPFIAIEVADNQKNNVAMLKANNIGFCINSIQQLTDGLSVIEEKKYRQNQVEKLSEFKLNGTQKIIDDSLLSLISLTDANESDVEDTYKLSVSDDVRMWSLNADKFSFENHKKWFNKMLKNPNQLLVVLKKKVTNEFIGQIRFDRIDQKQVIVSLSFTSQLRGTKIAHLLLSKSIDYARSYLSFDQVIAQVKINNRASKRTFEKVGFRLLSSDKTFETLEYKFSNEEEKK